MTKIEIIAPGRVCLFGDHQDYLGLPIIACAINLGITLSATPNNQSLFNLSLPDIDSSRKIDISNQFNTLEKRDYFGSALRVLRRYNCIPDIGYDITITGDVPINSGLSSSTAVTTAWVTFLLNAFKSTVDVTPEQIAKITFEAEVSEHNEPGGIMDQYSIAMGHIIFLNTEDASFQTFNHELDELIVSNSGVKKETIELISKIKTNTAKALSIVSEKNPKFSLAQATLDDFNENRNHIFEELIPYFYAAIKNHEITQKALHQFKQDNLDLKILGDLMNQHHTVLKDSLKITVPKIDKMIQIALENGAYGAKIVGSGGGGSIAILAPKMKHQSIINKLNLAQAESTHSVNVTNGARIIDYA